MDDLTEFQKLIRSVKPRGFTPHVFYNEPGDMMQCYIKDELSYTEWVSPYLAIFYGMETKEVTGAEICGIRKALQNHAEWEASHMTTPSCTCSTGPDKVHSRDILLTNPPKRPWICRKCLGRGVDMQGGSVLDEYEQLLVKSAARGNHAR